ncbi:hypothetical protein [Paludisphaera soli]|uniref:hypothetical protein n=1 Tax=Paludisphaera soli TaxID=2712865 RepID=UPI0013EE07C4|nr:hypothetical protein [Paludisphaera soli]
MRREVDRRGAFYDERLGGGADMIDRLMQRDTPPPAWPRHWEERAAEVVLDPEGLGASFLGDLAAAGSGTAWDLRALVTRAERLAAGGHSAATIGTRPRDRARRPSARIGTRAAARARVEGLSDAGCDGGPPAFQASDPMPRVETAGSIPAASSEGPR